MSTVVSLCFKKQLVTKPVGSLVLALFLGGLIFAPYAAFGVDAKISVDTPKMNGIVTVTIDNTNAPGIGVIATANILATDTCRQKATKISDAINAALTAKGPPESTLWSATAANRTVTINQQGGTGLAVSITKDTTGEGNKLRVHGDFDWLWSFFLWFADSDAVVPDGTMLAVTAQKPGRIPLSVSVMGNGVLSIAQLQQMVVDQFQAQGVTLTPVTNPETGQTGLVSQAFDGSESEGGGRVEVNAAWSTYLGTSGVGADSAQ
jgi:hypothetical protein